MHKNKIWINRTAITWQRPIRLLLLAIVGFILMVNISWSQPSASVVHPALQVEKLHQGIAHYQMEDYQGAIALWKEALMLHSGLAQRHPELSSIVQRFGEGTPSEDTLSAHHLTRALLLSNLSLAHQHLSQWAIAEDYISQSLALFDDQDSERASAPLTNRLTHRSTNRASGEWDYYAKALNTQGWLFWRQGQIQDALNTWQQTTIAYEWANNTPGAIGSRINQAQAMDALGLINQASETLKAVNEALGTQPDNLLKATSLRHFGNILRRLGQLEESANVLNQALAIVNPENNLVPNVPAQKTIQNNLHLDLGNTRRAQWDLAITLDQDNAQTYGQQAITEYQTAIKAASPITLQCLDAQTTSATLHCLHAQTNLMGFLVAFVQFHQSPQFRDRVVTSPVLSSAREDIILLWDKLVLGFQQLPSRQSSIKVQLDAIDAAVTLNCLSQGQKSEHLPHASHAVVNTPTSNRSDTIGWTEIITQLRTVLEQSRQLQDKRSESLTLGYLGHVYELVSDETEQYNQRISEAAEQSQNDMASTQWEDAATLTHAAINLAKTYQLPDILYRWQWQLGRISKHRGNKVAAIHAYTESAQTLETVRRNLRVRTSDIQFSFRDDVEPIYRDLVDLLLQDDQPSLSNLDQAIGLMDTLQLAELENFLDCDLSDTVELSQADIGSNAALIYAIIGDDHLDVVMKLPNSESANNNDPEAPKRLVLHHRTTSDEMNSTSGVNIHLDQDPPGNYPGNYPENYPPKTITGTLDILRRYLERDAFTDEADQAGSDLYRWMIKPHEAELKDSGVDTLVFVLDGKLRNVPMAALRDDQEQYLIEKYAIALTPRLQPASPQSFDFSKLNTLFLGLSQTTEAFPKLRPLPAVEAEAQIFDRVSIPAKRRLNAAFTGADFHQDIQDTPFSILHFATHGEFSSNPEETFLLAWDGKITSHQLRQFLQDQYPGNSIDLLVLSACKTAAGDSRATLGLAGIAFQAGAKSTMASLWVINDGTTAVLMDTFYQALISNRNQPAGRAKALQTAQLELLNQGYAPYFWAPFVLVGNW